MRAVVLLSDKDPNGAIQASESALRFDRTLTQAEFVRANAFFDVKRYDDALTSLDTVERQNPALAGANAQSLRGRILFKKRAFGESYQLFYQLQQASGRLRWLAPVLAGINMVFAGLFGSSAQYAWVGLLIFIVVSALYGISFIHTGSFPLGQWFDVVAILVVIGIAVFGYIRQTRGAILGGAGGARLTTLLAIVMAFLVGGALTLWIAQTLNSAFFHASDWFSPTTATLAGVVGLVLGAVAAAFWPRAAARYARQ